MRIAAESASFIEAFINVGLVPDSGSTFMLPRLVGVARAMELAVTGRKVKADEALQIGLVNCVVPDAELAIETMKLAQQLAALPTRAIGLTKRAINAAWSNDLDSQLDYEAMLQTTAGQARDHREGIAAFLEKRRPNFTGEYTADADDVVPQEADNVEACHAMPERFPRIRLSVVLLGRLWTNDTSVARGRSRTASAGRACDT